MTRAQKVGLAAALVVVIALGSHVTRWSGFDGLMIPAVVLGAAGFLLTVGVRRVGGGAYRTVHGHSSEWKAAAAHEAGHAAVALYVGAADVRARIQRSGAGWTSYRPPDYMTPAEDIAIALAGGAAEGVSFDSAPCRGDKASAARALRRAGWWSKGSTMREAERICAAGLRRNSGDVRRMTRRLERSGRVSAR
jgi:hypothetical protein